MKTKMGMAAAMMALSAGVAAEDQSDATGEVTIYGSHLTAKYDTLEDAGIDKPKGFGGGLKLSGYFAKNAEIVAEIQQNQLDLDAAGIDFDARARQFRFGIQGTLRSDNAASSAYLKYRAEYVHVDLKITADGFSGNASDSEDLPMAHVTAGGGTGPLNAYVEAGFGSNGDFEVIEGTAGLQYSFTGTLALMAEYRYSVADLKDIDEKAKYSDIRLGVTSRF